MSLDDLFSGFVMIFGGGLAFLAWAGPAVVFFGLLHFAGVM